MHEVNKTFEGSSLVQKELSNLLFVTLMLLGISSRAFKTPFVTLHQQFCRQQRP